MGPVGPTPPPRAVGKGLELAVVGERAVFTVSSVVQPRVTIEAAEGNIEAHIQSPKPGEYTVSYVPKWVGTYDVIIGIGPHDVTLFCQKKKQLINGGLFVSVARITFQTERHRSGWGETDRWLGSVFRRTGPDFPSCQIGI